MTLNVKVSTTFKDNGSSIIALSKDTISKLKLNTTLHSNLYRVSLENSTIIPIKMECLVSLNISSYEDKILCDVLPMDVRSIIFGLL